MATSEALLSPLGSDQRLPAATPGAGVAENQGSPTTIPPLREATLGISLLNLHGRDPSSIIAASEFHSRDAEEIPCGDTVRVKRELENDDDRMAKTVFHVVQTDPEETQRPPGDANSEPSRRRLARKTSSMDSPGQVKVEANLKLEPPSQVKEEAKLKKRNEPESPSKVKEEAKKRVKLELPSESKDEEMATTTQESEVPPDAGQKVNEKKRKMLVLPSTLKEEAKRTKKGTLNAEVKEEEKAPAAVPPAVPSKMKKEERTEADVKSEWPFETKEEKPEPTVKSEQPSEVKEEVYCKLEQVLKQEMKSEYHDVVKQEIKTEIKRELFEDGIEGCCDEEAGIKCEEDDIVKNEVKEEMGNKVKKEPEVKQEEQPEDEADEVDEVAKWKDRDPSTTFAARLPLFIRQCTDFQLDRRTWAPARPCCLANYFIEPLAPPPRDAEDPKSCYHRLTKKQRREFRTYVERCEAKGRIKHQRNNRHFLRLLHPERRLRKPRKSSGLPRQRLLVTPSAMKMWPWERDLDVRWWIGCGWVLTPEGPRRLKVTGAAPGTQIFEGKGKAGTGSLQQALEGAAGRSQDTAGEAVQEQQFISCTSAKASSGMQRDKCRILVQSKRSGVKGVSWSARANGWKVSFSEGGRPTLTYFIVGHYMTPSKSDEEADAEALRAAIVFRRGLEEQSGKAKVRTPPSKTSSVKGVDWFRNCWRARIKVDGKMVHGGQFKPKDETPAEVEKARLAAVEWRRESEMKYFDVAISKVAEISELVERTSGVKGITWESHLCQWRARVHCNGKECNHRFRPADSTPEGVDRARLAAVKWQDDFKLKHAAVPRAKNASTSVDMLD